MSDAAGEGPRVRRYPELPVWVVEDHQEVSGRGGARAWEAGQNRNVVPARVALRWGEPQDLGRVGAGVSGALKSAAGNSWNSHALPQNPAAIHWWCLDSNPGQPDRSAGFLLSGRRHSPAVGGRHVVKDAHCHL